MLCSYYRYSFDQFMYSIHFQLYLVIGVVLTIIGGLLVSFVTGKH